MVAAEPRHIPLLYCRAKEIGREEQSDAADLGGSLPPSPATIKRFVGRIDTVDRIFRWLFTSDEPRNFLYGRGGSGKTTIAYEVAKTLRFEGSRTQIYSGEILDNVIFVTAKEKSLDPIVQKQGAYSGVDFSSERELYESILLLGDWMDADDIEKLSSEQLKKELADFFDISSNFIVIDDVDTLTTKGLDAGFDYLYRTIARSKRQSKILYTLRNVPTHSLANAIEVPGLAADGEYQEFVDVCCNQFNVPHPSADFVEEKLAQISERRPLVVESIIALARHSGSHERALALFEQGAGDDVRGYVFQREWDALPSDNYGRFLLAVLALIDSPLSFKDLATILTIEESKVRDAIASVREMFLVIDDSGAEATYTVGVLTKSFILAQSKKLDRLPQLEARVDAFRKTFYPENPELTRLKFTIERAIENALRSGDNSLVQDAAARLTNANLSPKLTEDPRFRALQGYVAVHLVPPRVTDARVAFDYAMSMKYEPEIKYLKPWFEAEKKSGYGLDYCVKIADFINAGKTYSEFERTDFQVKKASVLYNRARDRAYLEPVSACDELFEALMIHLSAYQRSVMSSNPRIAKSEEFSRNTAYTLFNLLNRHGQIDQIIVRMQSFFEAKNVYVDPIEDPLVGVLTSLSVINADLDDLNRCKSKLQNVRVKLENSSAWLDKNVKRRILIAFDSTIAALAERIKKVPRRR